MDSIAVTEKNAQAISSRRAKADGSRRQLASGRAAAATMAKDGGAGNGRTSSIAWQHKLGMRLFAAPRNLLAPCLNEQ